MSDHTLNLESQIKKVNGVSIIKSRELMMASAIERLHKKMFKPADINKTMLSTKNE